MHLHEYQAKALFAEYGIPVPHGRTCRTPAEAARAAADLGGEVLVKAQIHAGARGKAGGIQRAADGEAVRRAGEALIGQRLATAQTGADGLPVHAVLVEESVELARELYLAATVDAGRERLVFMAAGTGGMEIEALAASEPERIVTVAVHPAAGYQPYMARRLAAGLELAGESARALQGVVRGLYELAVARDVSLAEINPLGLSGDGRLLAMDAKLDIDDSGLFRQGQIAELRDPEQEDPTERRATEAGLNYVRMDGTIGCMVNGAGLAMATMDLIQHEGGAPANFLDVGGDATAERVAEAFRLILAEGGVRAVLVNIFGGIVRCDLIAEGIIQAVQGVGVTVPVIVRLEGTNAEQGRAMLQSSGLDLEAAEALDAAARRAVTLAGAGR